MTQDKISVLDGKPTANAKFSNDQQRIINFFFRATVIGVLAAMLGIRGVDFVSLIGLFGAPCAISSYTMSRQMDSDYELSAVTVVFTSILSCFTLFFWIYLFKELNFFLLVKRYKKCILILCVCIIMTEIIFF